MKQKTFFIIFFSITFLSCSNPFIKKAYKMHEEWEKENGWYDMIANDVHQYNVTHDTSLLYAALDCLKNIPQNDDNKKVLFGWRLTVLGLLHEYDTVFAMLDTCQNDIIGNFGKKREFIITEISRYNYYHQYENRDQRIDDLVVYMEYCFERQQFIAKGNEAGYIQKYKDNQLALDAVATKICFLSLNKYMAARLLRGDDKEEIKSLIENYYQQKMIDSMDKEWLLGQLDGNYEEKDLDMLF